MKNVKLHIDEIIELVTCALNKTGRIRPWNRIRLRVCEHLIGKGLCEAAKPADLLAEGSYPLILPVLRQGAMVKLTQAGMDAICELPVDDYGYWFPTSSDVQRAKANCSCPDCDSPAVAVTVDVTKKVTDRQYSSPVGQVASHLLVSEMPGNSSVRAVGERDK